MNNPSKSTSCWFLTAVLAASLVFPTYAQKRALRYPEICAGIKVGSSKDADARRLYGKGYFVANEDHLGGRYYVDPKQHVTLHVEIGPDSIIDTVEYQQGIHLPGKPLTRILRRATTILPSFNKSTQKSFAFGVSVQSLLHRYGRPTKDVRSGQKRIIRYETDESVTNDVLFYAAEFHFLKDRLVYVRLENGE